MTTIAVPLAQGCFSAHFGGADAFALYEIEEGAAAVRARRTVFAPPHERGAFPAWLKYQGATVVLAGGMGPRAVDLLAGHGIAVVLGAQGSDPDGLVRDYLAGTLVATGEGCTGGSLHGCGDHDG